MSQFCAYELGEGRLVLDVQTDVIGLSTKVVVPLLPADQAPTPITILEPVFDIGGQDHVMHTAVLAAIPAQHLGAQVADLSDHAYEIRRALDLVFAGF